MQTAQVAIANPKNTYQTLAPIVIRELKLAGDLLLAARCMSIVPSQKLQQLTLAPKLPEVEEPISSSRSRTLTIPAEPRAAARALVDAFDKDELIELAEFLMQSVHQR